MEIIYLGEGVETNNYGGKKQGIWKKNTPVM